MQTLLLDGNLLSHEVMVLVATVAVCLVVAFLLSLGDGKNFDH